MTVILVLALFITFAVVDYFVHRKDRKVEIETGAEAQEPATVSRLRFHPGHTWLLNEGHQLDRVGADELAVQATGSIEKVELPQPGRWVRQGQKAWAFYHNGERIEMVSPAEGEVAEINPEVVRDPSLIVKDPYGKGWLMTVRVPDEESVERNLLPEELVPAWMDDGRRRLAATGSKSGKDVFLT
jgi:glycine cleavage system H lipoate-binding protein